MYWHGGYSWIWFMVSWLLLLGGLAWLTIWVVRHLSGGGASASESSARRILDERFARGELEEDEYRRRRDALER